MPRKANNVPANETAAQRFVRCANTRVNRLLKAMKPIGELGRSEKTYAHTPEQTKKIETVLREGLERAINQLNRKIVVNNDFKL